MPTALFIKLLPQPIWSGFRASLETFHHNGLCLNDNSIAFEMAPHINDGSPGRTRLVSLSKQLQVRKKAADLTCQPLNKRRCPAYSTLRQ